MKIIKAVTIINNLYFEYLHFFNKLYSFEISPIIKNGYID